MKTLEVIHLRLAGSGPEDLVDIIRRSIGSPYELMDIRIYRHSKLKNDLAIHLHREMPCFAGRTCTRRYVYRVVAGQGSHNR